ncbi:MAG: polyprenyl diphosphate synthase [Candidatus Taylorbacteria bacterium]|nr:polyprenyl diphosphate synthase [Candidatus Taylorbacteria bacterium]
MTQKTSPQSIGIILDGNRRWAREHNLPTLEGHRRGYEKTKEIVRWAKDAGIRYVTVYAFSTENWNRTPEEVAYLMDLFRSFLSKEVAYMKDEGVRILCAGERERFAPDIQECMKQAETETAGESKVVLTLALSYGGRAEIVVAANRASALGPITEETLSKHMWVQNTPDPDLIIRTGGEMRLSGFMTWQSVYSELFFTKTKLPDLSEEEFKQILSEFDVRERRNGV